MPKTGDEPSSVSLPDPHGEAALLLAESLLHFLIKRSVITNGEAVRVVQIASDALIETSLERGDTAQVPPGLKMLSLIAASLSIDIV